jgi:hypothetical protein
MEDKTLCPYCAEPIRKISRDHIFPQFLGGKREIRACANCNNSFGHTFEADAAKTLQPLYTALSGWGLPLKSTDAVWRKAVMHQGKPFDISVKQGKVTFRLSHRLPKRDAAGNIIAIECPSLEDARKAIKERERKQSLSTSDVPINRTLIRGAEIKGTTLSLEIGYSLQKLTLKMCIGLCSLFPEFNSQDFSEARARLKPEAINPGNVTQAYCTYESLDLLRPPLSHLIYIERNQFCVFGIVQFFGCIQFYTRLLIYPPPTRLLDYGGGFRVAVPRTDSNLVRDGAILASLDPVTGKEQFEKVQPLKLSEPTGFDHVQGSIGWMKKLERQLKVRGAKGSPELSFEGIKFNESPAS